MIDIGAKEDLLQYLLEKGLISDPQKAQVNYFSGGVSGTVAMVCENEDQMLVKQAMGKLKVRDLWECDPKRIQVEHNALLVYERIIPDCVPTPISYDAENYIMIREAVPEDWHMWKEALLDGKLNYQVAEKAIRALFTIHNSTALSDEVREQFQDSQFFYSLRISPYIEYVVEKYPFLKSRAQRVIDFLMNQQIALIHGDYSPKNILTRDAQICILDLEVAYFGNPCFDVAFFANHFLLKAVRRKEWGTGYLAMLGYMMNLYFSNVAYMDPITVEEQTVQTLGFLFLARVDGKSPVEYLTNEKDKELVRKLALTILNENFTTFEQVFRLMRQVVEGKAI